MAGCVATKAPPSPPRHTNLGIGISTTTLSNGLKVVLVRDERAPEVQVTMRYRVGAVDDGDHPGIAHMAEHLMFQQVLGNQTLFSQLEDFATFFNGVTTHETTTYVERAPITELDRMLSIEGVRLGLRCTTVTDAVFAREREVVVNEIDEADDTKRLFRAIHAAGYPVGHPFGRDVVGTAASVTALTREQVCGFVDAHYGPENAVLVVSGNLTPDDLATSLGKFIARIPRHPVAAPATVPPATTAGVAREAKAPVDEDALLVTWPMPTDPMLRVQVRAIAAALPGQIDASIRGRVIPVPLGEERAPMFAVVIIPAGDETIDEVSKQVTKAMVRLPGELEATSRIEDFGDIAFNRIQQSAIYRVYGSLESSLERDAELATDVLDGRDPNASLAAEFEGLRALSPTIAADIARKYLSVSNASLITLRPANAKKQGHELEVREVIHDMGQHRSVPDPADARRPATVDIPQVTGAIEHRLPNGLRVVMLPITSAPTVEVRLVFGAGTADEPVTRRGTALVAAYGLTWSWRYLNDLLAFYAAGGEDSTDVTADHTTFGVEGVDMHLDYLLAGLRRKVVDGIYETDAVVDALRASSKHDVDVNTTLADEWMTAVYGSTHPYAHAAIRHTSEDLDDEDAEQFRRAHFTPDNATLVITGHFDAVLAQRWVEFLFADWKGRAVVRSSPAAHLSPSSVGLVQDLQQAALGIALPVTIPKDRATQLVIAEMLNGIANDVRHQLGATYGTYASLSERRLARQYEIGGWVNAARAPEAMQFLADRIAQLRTDPDAAAKAFVIARTRVLVKLGSIAETANELGERVEHDIELGRQPLNDLETARALRALTIDQVTPALADLDLTHAAIFVRGPKDAVEQSFAPLQRTPKLVHFDQVAHDEAVDDPTAPATTREHKTRPREQFDSFESALVPEQDDQPTASKPWSIDLLPAYAMATYVDPQAEQLDIHCCSGAAIAISVGRAFDRTKTVGFHAGIATMRGHRVYKKNLFPGDFDTELLPIDLGVFSRFEKDRLWASLWLGLHLDRLYDESVDIYTPDLVQWSKGLGVGVQAGFDLLSLGRIRIAAGGEVDGALGSASGYGALWLGLAVRMRQ